MSASIFYKTVKNDSKYSQITLCMAIYTLSIAIISLQTGLIIMSPAEWCFMYLFYLYGKKIDKERHEITQQTEIGKIGDQEILVQLS